jgi:hypothetical protein
MYLRFYISACCAFALIVPAPLKAQAVLSAAPAASPSSAPVGTAPKKTVSVSGAPIFPTKLSSKYASEKPGEARLHTCLDQYHANKSANGNGNLKWIQKGGGYYSTCSKKLKA